MISRDQRTHPLSRLSATANLSRTKGRSANAIFGSIDELKLRSCATLFASVSPPDSVFHRLLDKYFQGKRDGKTLQLLDLAPKAG